MTLITGDTGSGKTTQVPQFILENAHDTRTPVRIVCTEPRRLAAVSVAERVSYERNEKPGGSVGFQEWHSLFYYLLQYLFAFLVR